MKYKQLADILRREINATPTDQVYRLPTEKELAEKYAMSRQTVRHALQILTDEGLIQRRQGSGSFTTGHSSPAGAMNVAVITAFPDDYIFPRVLHDAQTVLTLKGYNTTVYSTENQVGKERQILTDLLEHPVSGILVEGSRAALPNPNLDLYKKLQRMGTPIVFFHNCYPELSDFPQIVDDNYGGAYQLTGHLLKLNHRSIGGIFKSDDMQGIQRYHGTICALRDAGVPIQDRAFCWYDSEDRLAMLKQRDTELIRRFLTTRLDQVSAIVCYNDEIAFQVIGQLLAMGRQVPQDVAVVGFDNSYYSQIGQVRITSMRHIEHKTGQYAAQQLLNLMHGLPCRSKQLTWELIPRESSVKA